MRVSTMQIASLSPDDANPRKHDARNIEAISQSLLAHGQVEPIVVQQSTGVVIAGNGRVQAMKALGWDECRAVLVDIDDEEARALSIRLNRTAELAEWDDDVLAQHLAELGEFSKYVATDFGFSESEIEALIKSFAEATDGLDKLADEPADEPADDEDGLPPNTQPSDMKASKAQEVRLYLSPEQEQKFHMAIRRLAERWGTDNVTDTVVEALSRQELVYADDKGSNCVPLEDDDE